MLNKEQIVNLTEILAIGSVTAAGFLIGGTIGASVMAGIGLNLASNVVHGGASKLKEHWISGNNGILNHDIQRALLRAYNKALLRVEKEYFKQYNQLQENEQETTGAIRYFFKELAKHAEDNFLPSIESAIKEKEVKDYLYNSADMAVNLLWDRIGANELLRTYNLHFVNFLRENLLSEIQFCFTEELKTDNKECNKAWRAFQRLLLEGIKDDIKSIKTGQDNITADLQKLEIIECEIVKIKNIVARRTDNEPFQNNLEGIQSSLLNIASIANRTEIKIDALSDEVKKLTEPKSRSNAESLIPEEIKTLLQEASELWSIGEYKKSKAIYSNSLKFSIECKNDLAIAKSKRGIAGILLETDSNTDEAIKLLKESLYIFRKEKSESDIISVLSSLGGIFTDIGDFDKASSFLAEAYELAIKSEDRLETAHVFHRLGWLEDHKGNCDSSIDYYDKSQNIYFSILESCDDAKKIKETIWGIAGCYHLKGLVYRHKGDVLNSESSFTLAIEWYKKENLRPEMAKIYYLLSELYFREAEYDKGFEFLILAKNLYSELELPNWYSKCLELSARVHNTLGKRDEAENDIKQAFVIANSLENNEQIVNYLIDLGYISLEKNELEESKKYFNLAKNISYKNDYYENIATCVKDLAEIASIEKNYDERTSLLLEGIQALEKYLLFTHSKPKQGFLLGRIGMFFELLSKNEEALTKYQKAKKIFEKIKDTAGIASSLGSIASIKRKLNKPNEEFDIYREMKGLLEGTPYYDLIAGTAINLGELYLELGNLTEAKILFDEALFLCKKYNLHVNKYLENSLQRLSENEKLRKPPELDLNQLIDELFNLVNWFPEAKDSILRLWMWARNNELLSNYRNTASVKFMICEDNIGVFNELIKNIKPYGDLFLQVVSNKFPETALDFVPYPKDKPIFFDCDFPTVVR